MKRLRIFFITLSFVLAFGCFADSDGMLMKRSLPQVDDGYGKVVILRPHANEGIIRRAPAYNVYLNYFIVDKIDDGAYAEYRLPPGTYRLYAGNEIVSRTVQFDVKKGEEKFFETKMQSFGDDFPVIELEEIGTNRAKRQTKAMRKDSIDYNDPRRYPSLPIHKGQAS